MDPIASVVTHFHRQLAAFTVKTFTLYQRCCLVIERMRSWELVCVEFNRLQRASLLGDSRERVFRFEGQFGVKPLIEWLTRSGNYFGFSDLGFLGTVTKGLSLLRGTLEFSAFC